MSELKGNLIDEDAVADRLTRPPPDLSDNEMLISWLCRIHCMQQAIRDDMKDAVDRILALRSHPSSSATTDNIAEISRSLRQIENHTRYAVICTRYAALFLLILILVTRFDF
jgi:hypothetical protein